MGTWDAGSFDNDAALDYAQGLTQLSQIEATVRSALPDLEADAAAEVLAACDLVAALLGRPTPQMPEHLAPLLAGAGPPGTDLLNDARQAVQLVRTRSELAGLWGEDETAQSDWQAALDDLLLRLDPEQDHTPPPAAHAPEGEIAGHCFLCQKSGTEAEIVALVHEYDDGIVSSTMTLYAHRACVEDRFDPPHWNDAGQPGAGLRAQFGAMLDAQLDGSA